MFESSSKDDRVSFDSPVRSTIITFVSYVLLDLTYCLQSMQHSEEPFREVFKLSFPWRREEGLSTEVAAGIDSNGLNIKGPVDIGHAWWRKSI